MGIYILKLININNIYVEEMKKLGCHLSKSKCFKLAAALDIPCCQIFVKNPRGFSCKIPSDEFAEQFIKSKNKSDLDIVVHASYILNPCSPDKKKLNLTRGCFAKECQIAEKLGLKYIVFHPGSCLHNDEVSLGDVLKRCADTINYVHSKTENCVLLIENMAGEGKKIGYKLSHLQNIIKYVTNKSRVGICIDTCHAHGAGYPIHTEEGFNEFIKEVKDLELEKYIKVIHINDSKTPCGSRRDRHENVGNGTIGLEGIQRFLKYYSDTIKILETPDPKIDLKLLK